VGVGGRVGAGGRVRVRGRALVLVGVGVGALEGAGPQLTAAAVAAVGGGACDLAVGEELILLALVDQHLAQAGEGPLAAEEERGVMRLALCCAPA